MFGSIISKETEAKISSVAEMGGLAKTAESLSVTAQNVPEPMREDILKTIQEIHQKIKRLQSR